MVEPIGTLQSKALEAVCKVRAPGFLHRLRGDERGVTAMEYGLIAALIGAAAVAAVKLFGTNLSDVFTTAANKLANPS